MRVAGISDVARQRAHATAAETAPTPDLRIVPVAALRPHEDHDSQRALPLLERLRSAEVFTNPVIAAPIDGSSDLVVLDGSNRVYCFTELGLPHILVQVVEYDTPWLELGVWNHVVSDLSCDGLLLLVGGLEGVAVGSDAAERPLATLVKTDGARHVLVAATSSIRDRRALLREVVHLYQQRGTLNRTAHSDPVQAFTDFPDAAFAVLFPLFSPAEIIEAAVTGAYLPPGISRHIVHGRAVKLDYPLSALRDPDQSLDAKNAALQGWMHRKFANRGVRYYAESTYHFDE